jgi:hypothetical protein
MKLTVGYELQYHFGQPPPVIVMLNAPLHPCLRPQETNVVGPPMPISGGAPLEICGG